MSLNDDDWLQSSSGSGALVPWPDENIEEEFTPIGDIPPIAEDYQQEDAYVAMTRPDAADVFALEQLPPGQPFTTKIPPGFNGLGSFFAFEELVYDWVDITQLPPEMHGPSLKTRLTGEAATHRPLLDRPQLKDKDLGVEYFLTTLRPHYIKGAVHVFLYRLFQFMKLRRHRLDYGRWIQKFVLMRKRLTDSWMDLFNPLKSSTDARYNSELTDLQNRTADNKKKFTDCSGNFVKGDQSISLKLRLWVSNDARANKNKYEVLIDA